MSARERMTLLAGLATALAASALGPVYDDLGWLVRVLGGVAVVAAVGVAMRRASVPVLVQPTLQLVALGLYVAVVFARDTLLLGLVPGGATLTALRALADAGLADVDQLAPPVPTTPGLVLLAVLGVGAIGVLVDVAAVVLGRAAAAGLPLLLLFAVPSAVLTEGLGWWPFALTASGWLALLLAEGGDRVGRWGTPLGGTGDDASLGRVGRRIGAAALGVAVVVPALLPGLDTRLLDGGSGDGIGGGSGGRSSTTYNPITALSGQLNLPEPQDLFSYQTTDSSPDYIRLTTLDLFQRGQWSASELRGDPKDDRVDDGIPTPVGLTTSDVREFGMRVRISGLRTSWLPTPATPTDVDVTGRWVWDEEADTAFSAQQDTSDLDDPYELRAVRAVPARGSLTDVGALPNSVAPYAQPVPLTPRVAQLLGEVVDGATTDFERVTAIQDHLRETPRFTYDTLAPAAPRGQDPLEFFLLDSRRGFCEQYSSAMAGMVRALGLPSRVAVGFTPGTLNGTTDVRTVTTDQAHAWPEVWFEGAGWVRFEPTPRVDATSVPDYAMPEESTPATTPDSEAPVAEPSAGPTASAGPGTPQTRDDDQQAIGDPAALGGEGSGGRGLPPLPVLLLLLALVALALPSLGSVLRRRHRARAPGPLPAWAQVHDDATDVGHVFAPAESPGAAARRLVAERRLPTPSAEALLRLARAAELARYARPVEGAAEADPALLRDVAAVRDGLLQTASGRVRLRARLLPPSTVRWGSHVLGERVADVLDRVDEAVTSAGRLLRLKRTPRPS